MLSPEVLKDIQKSAIESNWYVFKQRIKNLKSAYVTIGGNMENTDKKELNNLILLCINAILTGEYMDKKIDYNDAYNNLIDWIDTYRKNKGA